MKKTGELYKTTKKKQRYESYDEIQNSCVKEVGMNGFTKKIPSINLLLWAADLTSEVNYFKSLFKHRVPSYENWKLEQNIYKKRENHINQSKEQTNGQVSKAWNWISCIYWLSWAIRFIFFLLLPLALEGKLQLYAQSVSRLLQKRAREMINKYCIGW